MRIPRTRAAVGSAAVAGLVVAIALAGADAQQPALPKEDQLKPKWAVNDSWVVETKTEPAQFRAGPDDKNPPPKGAEPFKPPEPVKTEYKFTVAAKEKLANAECFRIDVTVHPNAKNQPTTKLWFDTRTLALKQLQTQVPVDGACATITESFDSKDGPPAPVTGATFPVDMPVFVGGRAGEQSFSYEAASGPAGAKRAANDVAFAVDIKQTLTPVDPADKGARAAIPASFARSTAPLVKVELSTAERSVTQYWQVGQPWPVYSKSGLTESRLVSFTPATK
jgi:hypothetical protein